MTHYKLSNYIGLCTSTYFDKSCYIKNIHKVDCIECKKLYTYFKDDLSKIWCYARIDLKNKGII